MTMKWWLVCFVGFALGAWGLFTVNGPYGVTSGRLAISALLVIAGVAVVWAGMKGAEIEYNTKADEEQRKREQTQ